jgi:nucleoside-diphosphate-sugar epimerase
MSKLIFGCGYLGQRVARRWQAAGDSVTVLTRSAERAHQFRQQGFAAIVGDVTRPETLGDVPRSDTLLFAVGYDRSQSTTQQSIEEVYAGGIRNVLAALPDETNRFIYISTTGVYGPASGDWVDETTQPDPHRDGGRASLAAEQALTESRFAARSVILRLAGIYGRGRVPYIDKLRTGEPIPAPATGYLNLIHVEDAAQVVVAAAQAELLTAPRVYCVSDGQPVERGEYYSEVARQIGAPPPKFTQPDPTSPRAARAESNRRICNDRMLADLGVTLTYPEYRAGLAAILST